MWADTPGQVGLLTIAMKEAEVANVHANLAVQKSDNLGWMQLHTTHVVNAIDPTVVKKGPGNGYGLIKASKGVKKHINLAANSPEASENVKLHSVHVATSANNTVRWGNEILKLADIMKNTSDVSKAATIAGQIKALSEKMIEGFDANGDGNITWIEGEGGLAQASKHLSIMQKGEGLI